jgi:DNA-directed RNA polymerase specialized sigma24 family protein
VIANIEGCSIGAAKVRLHRARQRLRQILEADNE